MTARLSPTPKPPTRPDPPPVVEAEERPITLPTPEWIDEVWLGEQRLAVLHVDRFRTPYIEEQDARSITIRLTDWVGRLPFRMVGESGSFVQEVVVYPAKLSRDPAQAFDALSKMVAELPQLQSRLRFEGQLPEALRDLQAHWREPLRSDTLLNIAGQAQRLWQLARRQPHVRGRAAPRRVVGGQVPDRVDWNLTLDLWGRGDFPQHVALDLPAPQPPASLVALRELWQALEDAAGRLPASPERDDLQLRFGHALANLPRLSEDGGPRSLQPSRDPITRHAQVLSAEVRGLTQSTVGLPAGRVRMAELYEFWAQVRLARALGAVQGDFSVTSDGLYQGTLTSESTGDETPHTTVSLNPKLSFLGVGQSSQTLQPDLLAVFREGHLRGQAVVADMKYRPIDRMTGDQQREVNDQLLRYMGLSGAATGLVVWPGGDVAEEADRLRLRELYPGRTKLVRLRLHPLDPPRQLDDDLHVLGLL